MASWQSTDLQQRLSNLPRLGLPVKSPVFVHWDVHQIPFVEAREDDDLAVALGVIHVHLRWGQMEIMRRLALGRVSEMIGPFGVKFDQAIRSLGLARTASAISAVLPSETALWLEKFVLGVNHAIERIANLPSEFRLLGLDREPWRVEDVLALGRLAAIDATWLSWIPLLQERDEGLVAELWRRATGREGNRSLSQAASNQRTRARCFSRWLARAGGSNSIVVGPSRSASGGALIASDPHLPVTLPNPFIIVGYKSPTFHVVGLMIPGLPFVALGRNRSIAWGGTNLHAASSDLFDVSDLPPPAIRERRERLRVRWWPTQTVKIRETDYGPIVSDLSVLGRGRHRRYALRWLGSLPSDETTAMLRLNRASNWSEFRAALEGFAVPAQTMTYADIEGHVGKVMAAKLPNRPPTLPSFPVRRRSDVLHWKTFTSGRDLPAEVDPAEGIVVSANEKPPATALLVGYLFSSSNRHDRLRQLLCSNPLHQVDDLARIQQDTAAPTSDLELRDMFVRVLRSLNGHKSGSMNDLIGILAAWDGQYAADSRGAAAFELLSFHISRAISGGKRQNLYGELWNGRELAHADIAGAGPGLLQILPKAATATMREFTRRSVWGDLHRLRLSHFAAVVPILGRLYQLDDWPVAGGDETVMKTAHPPVAHRHHVRLAPSARHISDLSSMDANYFVLLGGQDGWLGSTTALDQLPLWRAGRHIQVPLSVETVRRTFPIHLELAP